MPGTWEVVISPWPSNVLGGYQFQAIHLIRLYTGQLLALSHDNNEALVWDPFSGAYYLAPGTPARLFCCGHCHLADGRILFAGGDFTHYIPPPEPPGEATRQAWVFNPALLPNNPWTQCPDMAFRRYYPTCTMLPDGRVLVVSGRATNESGSEVRIPELFTPSGATGTWTSLPNLTRHVAMYSFLHVLPDGRLFLGGPWKGPKSAFIETRSLPPSEWTWGPEVAMPPDDSHDPPIPDGYIAGLTEGSAVMHRPGKIIKAGGDFTQDGSVGAVTVDLTPTTPPTMWSIAASLNFSRRNLNLVALPDGKVLCVGGNGYGASYDDPTGNYTPLARLIPEMWNPDNPPLTNWTNLVAEMTDPRYYHSTAMLLQDARVITAGGEEDGPTGNPPPSPPYTVWSAQIFKPPYLDNSPQRTTITSAPSTIACGAVNYTVQYTPQSADIEIAKGCLLRHGAVTHSYDQDQRRIPLTPQMTTQQPGIVTFSLNLTANIAPPGYYDFFILQQVGSQLVPCTLAKVVKVG